MTRAQVSGGLLSLILAGCGTSASPATSGAASAAPATPSPSAAVALTFVSPIYHYQITLPPGTHTYPATVAWTGKTAVSHDGADIDLFTGPTLAWGYALRTSQTLTTFTVDFNRAVAVAHPCAVKPEIERATTLDGLPAVFESQHCAPVTGILVLSELVAKTGTIYIFQFQDPARVASDDVDRAAFAKLLTSVHLP